MSKGKVSLVLVILFLLCWIAPCYSAFFSDTVISGFSLEKVGSGKTIYSIKADKAIFANKRIGFLNIAFIKVINLENVDFVLYDDNGQIIKQRHFDKAVYEINSKCLFDEDGNVVFYE